MVYNKSNNIDVKKINKNAIFRYILKNGKLSNQNIVDALKMSVPTVLQNTNELLRKNLIKEVGEFESSGGRKAKALSINKNARFALGLDITENNISLVLVNLLGQIEEHLKIDKKFEYTDSYFESMSIYIESLITKTALDRNTVLGVGISIPGIMDKSDNCIASSHVLGFKRVPCDDFSKYINFPCIFINDASAAGFAEFNVIDNNTVYLSISNSIGGAILFEKKLYIGDNIRSGEFGHMTIVLNGKNCYCGKIGCFDAYCKATILSNLTNGNLEKFFHDMQNGNKHFKKIWDEYLYYLSIAVNNLRMAFDCDIIIGGYIGSYFNNYINCFKKRVSSLNTFENNGEYVKVCKYHFEASALGAALKHIEHFITTI